MKTPTWTPVKIADREGFTFILSFEEEDMDPRNHFINECGWTTEEYKSISNFYWFTAKVTAYKGSIACGETYLGACCYKTLTSVLEGEVLGGYGPQLIDEALEDAKANLASEVVTWMLQ